VGRGEILEQAGSDDEADRQAALDELAKRFSLHAINSSLCYRDLTTVLGGPTTDITWTRSGPEADQTFRSRWGTRTIKVKLQSGGSHGRARITAAAYAP
jgi:hypothetical protein